MDVEDKYRRQEVDRCQREPWWQYERERVSADCNNGRWEHPKGTATPKSRSSLLLFTSNPPNVQAAGRPTYICKDAL